ncbi:MAG: arsenic resistance N-acetyltransferase ArsN2 [Candidatus Eiseniibacteriota bacterium]
MVPSDPSRAPGPAVSRGGLEWCIRPAADADLPAVRALVSACGLPEAGLEDQFEGFAVAVGDGRIVGVAGLERHGRQGLLRSVAVDGAWRSRGVAAALVADRLERALADGLESVHLLTTTASDWFARAGFLTVPRSAVPEAVRRSSEFARVCPESAVVMVRRLDDRSRL